jgi:hypothetical protein
MKVCDIFMPGNHSQNPQVGELNPVFEAALELNA